MQLLSPKKQARDQANEEDERKIVSLKLRLKKAKEMKALSDLYEDWEPEKRKRTEEFFKWHQGMQEKKARIINEINELEKKREKLIENIRIHI